MEVWALEGYGAANVLQEILTVKSDDIRGRDKTYERIVKGQSLVKPGVPESFRVLVKELQGLGLDVDVTFDDGSHGDIPMEDDDKPAFNARPPEVFQPARRPKRSRKPVKPTLEDITEPGVEPEISDELKEAAADIFGSEEPDKNITDNNEEAPKLSEILSDSGEGEN